MNSFYFHDNKLFTNNHRYVGEVDKTEDGYYVWWPASTNVGYLSSGIMKEISALLDTLNEEWDAIVQKEIGNE